MNSIIHPSHGISIQKAKGKRSKTSEWVRAQGPHPNPTTSYSKSATGESRGSQAQAHPHLWQRPEAPVFSTTAGSYSHRDGAVTQEPGWTCQYHFWALLMGPCSLLLSRSVLCHPQQPIPTRESLPDWLQWPLSSTKCCFHPGILPGLADTARMTV